jgi:hypothetical protein
MTGRSLKTPGTSHRILNTKNAISRSSGFLRESTGVHTRFVIALAEEPRPFLLRYPIQDIEGVVSKLLREELNSKVVIDMLSMEPPTVGNANTLNNAGVVVATRSVSKALHVMECVVSMSEILLGSEHLQTHRSRVNLAVLYTASSTGLGKEAHDIFERSISAISHHLGRDHPDACMALIGYAQLLAKAGRRDDSVEKYVQALQVCGRAHRRYFTVGRVSAWVLRNRPGGTGATCVRVARRRAGSHRLARAP